MMRTNNRTGYIMILTLTLIGLFVASVTYLMQKNTVFSAFTKTMVEREKARQLAYGGIQLALSQLAYAAEQEKKEETQAPAKANQGNDAKQFIKTMLPLLNNTQEFVLKKGIDGVDGKIGFRIGSQEGKININRVYDFKEHKFVNEGNPEGDMKKIMQQIFALIKENNGADLFAELEKFLKERKQPLNDVTELLTVKGFEIFKDKIFYEPAPAKQKPTLYLADLFTVDTQQPGFDVWMLSPSLQALFGFAKPEKLNMEELLKLFKESLSVPQESNALIKQLYGADFSKLGASLAPLTRTTFEPKLFSVVSYGTIGGITVRFLALVEREKKEGKDATGYTVAIRKVYSI